MRQGWPLSRCVVCIGKFPSKGGWEQLAWWGNIAQIKCTTLRNMGCQPKFSNRCLTRKNKPTQRTAPRSMMDTTEDAAWNVQTLYEGSEGPEGKWEGEGKSQLDFRCATAIKRDFCHVQLTFSSKCICYRAVMLSEVYCWLCGVLVGWQALWVKPTMNGTGFLSETTASCALFAMGQVGHNLGSVLAHFLEYMLPQMTQDIC